MNTGPNKIKYQMAGQCLGPNMFCPMQTTVGLRCCCLGLSFPSAVLCGMESERPGVDLSENSAFREAKGLA